MSDQMKFDEKDLQEWINEVGNMSVLTLNITSLRRTIKSEPLTKNLAGETVEMKELDDMLVKKLGELHDSYEVFAKYIRNKVKYAPADVQKKYRKWLI